MTLLFTNFAFINTLSYTIIGRKHFLIALRMPSSWQDFPRATKPFPQNFYICRWGSLTHMHVKHSIKIIYVYPLQSIDKYHPDNKSLVHNNNQQPKY